jgi:hypothetical protein
LWGVSSHAPFDSRRLGTLRIKNAKHYKARKKQEGCVKHQGKMTYVAELLSGSEPKTKSEVVKLFMLKFPDVSEKTAKNTVSWMCSPGLKRRGLTPTWIPEEKAPTVEAEGEKPVRCSIKGLTQFIYDLRMQGKTLEQVIEAGRAGPYPGLGPGWFKDRWNSTPRGAEAPAADAEGSTSMAGRAAYIRQLRRDGLNWDDAMEKINLKYPGSSPANCMKIWNNAESTVNPGPVPEKLTFLGLAEKILREEQRPMSPAEIWKAAQLKGYDKQIQSSGRTPSQTLYGIIFLNVRNNPNAIFYKIGERPARYFLKELKGTIKPDKLEEAVHEPDTSTESIYEYKEADLHPFLAYFASRNFNAFTKTIHHNTSTKKNFGEWVHPDMIGVYFPVKDWKPEVLDLSAQAGNTALKLYSFELKKALSFGTLREAFFQAVSNSSWANEGYLAAAEISQDEDFLSELQRLSTSFGVGVIELSIENPDESKCLYPARERELIDWDALNKLAMNKDVQDLLKRITTVWILVVEYQLVAKTVIRSLRW